MLLVNFLTTTPYLGLLYTLLLFLLSLTFSIGIRFLFNAFTTQEDQNSTPPTTASSPKKQKPKTKSIVIDPEEIGRIYVRKTKN